MKKNIYQGAIINNVIRRPENIMTKDKRRDGMYDKLHGLPSKHVTEMKY